MVPTGPERVLILVAGLWSLVTVPRCGLRVPGCAVRVAGYVVTIRTIRNPKSEIANLVSRFVSLLPRPPAAA
jgi:hypothetical protein